MFWIIFNFDGSVGSFVSFGLNYHSTAGTVTNPTYIAFIVVMAFGWFLGVFICPPSKIGVEQLEVEEEKHSLKAIARLWIKMAVNWRGGVRDPNVQCLLLLPTE